MLDIGSMISVDDANQRILLLRDNLDIFRQQTVLFQQKTRSTDELQRTKREMEERLGKLGTRELDAETAAETYDREFLDRKNNQPDPYVKDTLATLQDRTLAVFTLYFGILVLAVLITVYVKSRSLKTTGMYFLYLAVAAIVIFGLIFKYA